MSIEKSPLHSLAAQGDFPAILARLHPRFHTPAIAILLCALTAWVLAISGTFLWLVALGSGAAMVLFTATCASLVRLRKLRPNVAALRIPFGPVLSIVAITVCLALTTGLKRRELLVMCVTSLIAAANWLWAKRCHVPVETVAKSAAASYH